MTDKLVILAAGASSRMKLDAKNVSLTELQKNQANLRSKSLISITDGDRPFMDYLLYNAKKSGYKIVYIITGKENKLFKSYYGSKNAGNKFNGLIINFAIQSVPEDREKPLGTSDALYQAMNQYPELMKSFFTICNGDNLYSVKALNLLREYGLSQNALISYDRDLLDFTEERISKFAILKVDKDNYLLDIIEKPQISEIMTYKDKDGKLRISMNIFKFYGPMIYTYIENCPMNEIRHEKELPTAILNMINNENRSMYCLPLAEHVPDLTLREDILKVAKYVRQIDISKW